VKATGWMKGLEVTADGTGIVSHAGVALLRSLSDRTGLTGGLSRALASSRLLVHDRGRVLADLACAVADGAEVISDFRVMTDQAEVFGLVASVPTAWRTLDEIASGGGRAQARIIRAVNAARRRAWAGIEARHGAIPGVRVADKVLEGVTCLRLDATVVTAHSDGKEGAEPNFKGFGLHPLGCWCDNTGEPLAGMLRPGSAGSNTTADHLAVLEAAIAALPPKHRRRLMVTCDGAGASHGLIERLDQLASRPSHHLIYSVGWELAEREKKAIAAVPEEAWQIAVDPRGEVRERRADDACADRGCAHRRCWIEEAHVTELTGLLREGPAGDQLAGWPEAMRIFARRERPHPGAQLTLFEAADGWRYCLWVTNLPATLRGWRGQLAYIDAAHRVHARVEDAIRTGKDTGIGRFPSQSFAINQAWLSASLIAATLLAWLKLLALDSDLARAEPKTLRYRVLHAAARLTRSARRRQLKISAAWPWADAITTAWTRIAALPHAP
jgi:Transposase DDE domain group 1